MIISAGCRISVVIPIRGSAERWLEHRNAAQVGRREENDLDICIFADDGNRSTGMAILCMVGCHVN